MSMDLQKAPEGATHFHYGNFKYSSHWYKEGYFCIVGFEDEGWKKDFDPIPKDQYVELYPQPKTWSGPEDGLPPIGMKFAFKGLKSSKQDCLYAMNDWCAGDIVCVAAHVMLQGSLSALYWNEGKMSSSTVRPDLLELIRTPEEIAVDARETAIRELMDIAQVDCRVTAARLVDAGFKMPSKSGEDKEQGISDLRDHIAHANFRRLPNSGDEELAKQLYGAGFRRERTPDSPFR